MVPLSVLRVVVNVVGELVCARDSPLPGWLDRIDKEVLA